MKKIYVSFVGATDSNLSYYSWTIEKRQFYTAASIIISGVLQKILVPGIQRRQKTKRIKEQLNYVVWTMCPTSTDTYTAESILLMNNFEHKLIIIFFLFPVFDFL